jgi:hypothetical protein
MDFPRALRVPHTILFCIPLCLGRCIILEFPQTPRYCMRNDGDQTLMVPFDNSETLLHT